MSIKFTILGCGYSLGVPRIDGNFGKCDPKNIKNHRTRCSALISTNTKNILIDTSPDLKHQLVKNNVKNIDKVFYTHMHADQTHGINDLRFFYLKNRVKLQIYADNPTRKYLISAFKYCFKKTSEYPPTLKMNNLKNIYNLKDGENKINLKAIKVKHGKIDSICYIINNKCAYASDVSDITNKNLRLFYNLNYLVIDCLREASHYSHYNLYDILNLIKDIKPKKTILTNLDNSMDYESLKKKLPNNIVPAYDGMSFYL